jgi:hypothetical protein
MILVAFALSITPVGIVIVLLGTYLYEKKRGTLPFSGIKKTIYYYLSSTLLNSIICGGWWVYSGDIPGMQNIVPVSAIIGAIFSSIYFGILWVFYLFLSKIKKILQNQDRTK